MAFSNYNKDDEHQLFEITFINGTLLRFTPDIRTSILVQSRHGRFSARLTIVEHLEFTEIGKELAQEKGLEEQEEEVEQSAVMFEIPADQDYWLHYQITIGKFHLSFKFLGPNIFYSIFIANNSPEVLKYLFSSNVLC